MRARLVRFLVRLYPRAWRRRYGSEFQALLEDSPNDMRASANVICSALREHILPARGHAMHQNLNCFGAIVRRPTAYLPIAMSLTALSLVAGTLISSFIRQHSFVVVHQPDEGAVAHLWQLLMAGQLPVLFFFAIKWLPRAPKQALCVLALQATAAFASLAPVFFLNL